jgi:hypothetical protein
MNLFPQLSISSLLVLGFVFHMKTIIQNCRDPQFAEAFLSSYHDLFPLHVFSATIKVAFFLAICFYFQAGYIAATIAAMNVLKIGYVYFLSHAGKKVLEIRTW